MGIHERAEKILAPADYSRACSARQSNCFDPGVGRRALYLYAFLSLIPLDRSVSCVGNLLKCLLVYEEARESSMSRSSL